MQLTVILINMQPIYYKNTSLSSGSGTDSKYLVYYLVRLKLAAHLKCTKLDPVNVTFPFTELTNEVGFSSC